MTDRATGPFPQFFAMLKTTPVDRRLCRVNPTIRDERLREKQVGEGEGGPGEGIRGIQEVD
jgi:hypothetical protein